MSDKIFMKYQTSGQIKLTCKLNNGFLTNITERRMLFLKQFKNVVLLFGKQSKIQTI